MRAPDRIRPAAPASVHTPVLRGWQPVAALWFPADWFNEAERARRLLNAWRPGDVAWRFAEGDLLCHASPQSRLCDELPGWPLRREGRALSSAPLTPAERQTLPAADAWIVRGGEVLALRTAEAESLEPWRWLAVNHVALHDSHELRATLPAPIVITPDARPLHDVLGPDVPPPSERRSEFLQSVKQRAEQRVVEPGRTARPGQPGHGWRNAVLVVRILLAAAVVKGLMALWEGQPLNVPLWAWVVGVLLGLVAAYVFSRIAALHEGESRLGTAGRQPGRSATPGAGGIAPRASGRVRAQRWRDWAARWAMFSGVSRLLGRKQAEYLRDMLAMFERGDLKEALRHAIPLDGEAQSLGQAFGTPGPRADLSLQHGIGPAINMGLGDDLQAHLRRTYRQTFERLDREKRIDEAVFVLAELLGARQEALDYLERHERFAQAAELALAWDRPPGVIVRLHCLAGDWRRAVAVARRDMAFAGAVMQLEGKWPEVAARLRAAWGEALAQHGDWLGAVDAAWPVASLREQARDWLLTAEAHGGALGARALVQRAVLCPDTLVEHHERLRALRDDPTQHAERAAAVDALFALKQPSDAARAIAAALAGPLLADQVRGVGRHGHQAFTNLATLARDTLLQADLPDAGWPVVPSRPAAERPWRFEAPPAGQQAIADAAPLDDERTLIALGERGVVVADASGRVLLRFDTPAHRLVLAHDGQVALALASRDDTWRVSRLDLTQRRSTDLGFCRLDRFADRFDGIGWLVAQGRAVRLLDTVHDLREVLWQVPNLPGEVTEIHATAAAEQVVLRVPPRPGLPSSDKELWRYQLPGRRLVQRDPMPIDPYIEDVTTLQLVHAEHGLVNVRAGESWDTRAAWEWTRHNQVQRAMATLALSPLHATHLMVSGDTLLIGSGEGETAFQWVTLAQGEPMATLSWPEGAGAQVRAVDLHWIVTDLHGRVFRLDASTGSTRAFSLR